MIDVVIGLKTKVAEFEKSAHEILATQESSKSRVISLYQSLSKLDDLSLDQDDQFRQALHCIEQGLYKAAYVMSWAAFIDFLEERLASDGLVKVHASRPKWSVHLTIEALRESVPESQLIDVARDVGLLSKSDAKSVQGALSRRNECAHPSRYRPELNESLGYVSELLNRVEGARLKSL